MINRNVHTFIGCDASYEESRLVLFGAPFDSTTSYRPGARFGSSAMRNESFSIETYSPYLDRDLTDYAIMDSGDLELPFGSAERALKAIEAFGGKLLDDGKHPLMLGGEHLVTLGLFRAAAARYPNLHLLHFDAHLDLRTDYLGETLSHASVIRRCWELVGDHRIFQFGIRSGDRPEFIWGRDHVHTQKFNFDGLEAVVEKLKGLPVYLTIDLDVLDPSIMSGTGTPEAGGVTFEAMQKALSMMSSLNIVASDLAELAPQYDPSGASTSLACKLLREMMLEVYPNT